MVVIGHREEHLDKRLGSLKEERLGSLEVVLLDNLEVELLDNLEIDLLGIHLELLGIHLGLLGIQREERIHLLVLVRMGVVLDQEGKLVVVLR